MVDTNEIKELRKLGIVKRKSGEYGQTKYEYSFKPTCADCGKKVDWCMCTETLEEAKKVLDTAKHFCYACSGKPENMSEYSRKRMDEIMEEQKKDGREPDWDFAFEQLTEEWADQAGEPFALDDGTEYWECECPIDIPHDDEED